MRQLFPPHKLKAKSYKPKALNFRVKVFCLKLSALGFLLTSFGTRIGLLWRRSVQVKFSMASSFLGSFHNVGWRMADGRRQKSRFKKNPPSSNSFLLAFQLPAFSFQLPASGFRLLAFGFLLSAFSFSAHAQNPPKIDTTIAVTDSANVYYDDSTSYVDGKMDTAKIDNKKIMAAIFFLSEDSVRSLRQSKAFGYMAYIDSLLKAREAAKKKQPSRIPQRQSSSVSFWDFGIVQVLCWTVAIGVVGFVLYKLFIGNGGAFSGNAKNNIPLVKLDEEPDMDDLDGLLKRAVQADNYRLATRYLFLKTLQQLSHKNAISLSTEKTDIQYSQELRDKPYAESFARLCLLYEYVWFGKFDINEAQFDSILQQQQQLAKAI